MEWQDSAASETVRVLTFPSGRRVKLVFHHDQEMISFLGAKSECYTMDELCFYFELKQYQVNYKRALSTVFLIESGQHTLKWTDRNREMARLRIGPFLAQLFQEETFSTLGLDRGLEVHHTVRITVSTAVRAYLHDVSSDVLSFVSECGSRGIRASRDVSIPTEVAALFSNYFHNIYYGNFKEKGVKFVEIQDVNIEALLDIIAQSAFFHKPSTGFLSYDSRTFVTNLFEHSDRFGFTELFNVLQDIAVQRINAYDAIAPNLIPFIQEWAFFVRKCDLLALFVKKFCIVECLEKFEKERRHEIGPQLAALINERKIELRKASVTRPMARMRYEAGDIVIALLEEINPRLVKALIGFFKNGIFTFNAFPKHPTKCIFLTKQTYLVIKANGLLKVQEGYAPSDGMLAGVVVSGLAAWQQSSNMGISLD